jgi:hypothetical protein
MRDPLTGVNQHNRRTEKYMSIRVGIPIRMATLALIGGDVAVTAAPAAQVASCASSLCSRQE